MHLLTGLKEIYLLQLRLGGRHLELDDLFLVGDELKVSVAAITVACTNAPKLRWVAKLHIT